MLLLKEKKKIMTETVQNTTFLKRIKTKLGLTHEKNTLISSIQKGTSQNTSIFQSLKSVNIELWNEILETGNEFLLDAEYFEGKKYSEKTTKEINETYLKFYDEFFIKLDNKFAKSSLIETQEKIYLSAKILILIDCVNTLRLIQRNYKNIVEPIKAENDVYKAVKTISKYVQFKNFNSIEDNILIIEKLLASNETTFKRKFGETEIEQKEVKYSFEKQVVDVEQILGRTIQIENVNVLKWIEYINLATQISKQRQENGRSKK